MDHIAYRPSAPRVSLAAPALGALRLASGPVDVDGELVFLLPLLEEEWDPAPVAVEGGREPDVVLPECVAVHLELVAELLFAWRAVEGLVRNVVGEVVDVPDVPLVPLPFLALVSHGLAF